MGFKVSKLVTVILQPKGQDISDIETQVFMISDMGQALERDNVYGESDKPGKMVVREPGPDELVPQILTQNKTVKDFDSEFFLVSLAHGQPAHDKGYNILKVYEVPNNFGELRGYLKKFKGMPTHQ